MDRLPFVIGLALLAGSGCDNNEETKAPPRQRVNAVAQQKQAPLDPTGMCDHHAVANRAPKLTWPKLTSSPPANTTGSWHWINLWATWCKPCVNELPRLREWRDRFAQEGVPVRLTLISADESDEDVSAFRAKHPKTPASLRLSNPEEIGPWVESLGVKGATLPIQVFVDPQNRVRCVRASAVADSDFAMVKALLSSDR